METGPKSSASTEPKQKQSQSQSQAFIQPSSSLTRNTPTRSSTRRTNNNASVSLSASASASASKPKSILKRSQESLSGPSSSQSSVKRNVSWKADKDFETRIFSRAPSVLSDPEIQASAIPTSAKKRKVHRPPSAAGTTRTDASDPSDSSYSALSDSPFKSLSASPSSTSAAPVPRSPKRVEMMKSRKEAQQEAAVKTVVPSSSSSSKKGKQTTTRSSSSQSTITPKKPVVRGRGRLRKNKEDDESATEKEDDWVPPASSSQVRKRKSQAILEEQASSTSSGREKETIPPVSKRKKARMVTIPASALSPSTTSAEEQEDGNGEGNENEKSGAPVSSSQITKEDFSTRTKASLRPSTLASSSRSRPQSQLQASFVSSEPQGTTSLFPSASPARRPVSKRYGKQPQSRKSPQQSQSQSQQERKKAKEAKKLVVDESGTETETEKELEDPPPSKRAKKNPKRALMQDDEVNDVPASSKAQKEIVEPSISISVQPGREDIKAVSSSSSSTLKGDSDDEEMPEVDELIQNASQRADKQGEKNDGMSNGVRDEHINESSREILELFEMEKDQHAPKQDVEEGTRGETSKTLEPLSPTRLSNSPRRRTTEIREEEEDDFPTPHMKKFDLPPLVKQSPYFSKKKQTVSVEVPTPAKPRPRAKPSASVLSAASVTVNKEASASRSPSPDVPKLVEESGIEQLEKVTSPPATIPATEPAEPSTIQQASKYVNEEESSQSQSQTQFRRVRLPRAAALRRTNSRVNLLRDDEALDGPPSTSRKETRKGTPELPVPPLSSITKKRKRKTQGEDSDITFQPPSSTIQPARQRRSARHAVQPPTCRTKKSLPHLSGFVDYAVAFISDLDALPDYKPFSTRKPHLKESNNLPSFRLGEGAGCRGLPIAPVQTSAVRNVLEDSDAEEEVEKEEDVQETNAERNDTEDTSTSALQPTFAEKLQANPGYGLDLLLKAALQLEAEAAEEGAVMQEDETADSVLEVSTLTEGSQKDEHLGFDMLWNAILERHPELEDLGAIPNSQAPIDPDLMEEGSQIETDKDADALETIADSVQKQTMAVPPSLPEAINSLSDFQAEMPLQQIDTSSIPCHTLPNEVHEPAPGTHGILEGAERDVRNDNAYSSKIELGPVCPGCASGEHVYAEHAKAAGTCLLQATPTTVREAEEREGLLTSPRPRKTDREAQQQQQQQQHKEAEGSVFAEVKLPDATPDLNSTGKAKHPPKEIQQPMDVTLPASSIHINVEEDTESRASSPSISKKSKSAAIVLESILPQRRITTPHHSTSKEEDSWLVSKRKPLKRSIHQSPTPVSMSRTSSRHLSPISGSFLAQASMQQEIKEPTSGESTPPRRPDDKDYDWTNADHAEIEKKIVQDLRQSKQSKSVFGRDVGSSTKGQRSSHPLSTPAKALGAELSLFDEANDLFALPPPLRAQNASASPSSMQGYSRNIKPDTTRWRDSRWERTDKPHQPSRKRHYSSSLASSTDAIHPDDIPSSTSEFVVILAKNHKRGNGGLGTAGSATKRRKANTAAVEKTPSSSFESGKAGQREKAAVGGRVEVKSQSCRDNDKENKARRQNQNLIKDLSFLPSTTVGRILGGGKWSSERR